MPDSTVSKQKPKDRAGRLRFIPVPRPRVMGRLVLALTILAFIAGRQRNELALTLLGTILFITVVWCFIGVLFLGLVHYSKARSLSMMILNDTVELGKAGGLLLKTAGGAAPGKRLFWRLPAILIRCELCLETKDGRVIRHYTDPGAENRSSFPVRERGAYYGEYDRFVICDAPGFFRLSLPVPGNRGARLLALPRPAEEPVPLSPRSGGYEARNEPHYRKSDELTDHRPYIPGDDPRRINWKLYSHAPMGELFVREGEPEPPPHSRLLVLIDTEADPSLYTMDEARQGVDLLCENALGAALEFSDKGMDIFIGYTGGGSQQRHFPALAGNSEGGTACEAMPRPLGRAELAPALAWPAAVMRPAHAELPAAPNDRAVLVLAMPRQPVDGLTDESSALDRFLKKREAGQLTDIMFICGGDGVKAAAREEAARVCAALYGRMAGVKAGC